MGAFGQRDLRRGGVGLPRAGIRWLQVASAYKEALDVGFAIEELDFLWYEDPLGADDIDGYVRLKQHLSIPIVATEITGGGLRGLTPWIASRGRNRVGADAAVVPRLPTGFIRQVTPAGTVGADARHVLELLGLSDHLQMLVSTGAVVDVEGEAPAEG